MSNIVDQLLKLDANEIEMPKGTHKMYCKKLGQELEFEIETDTVDSNVSDASQYNLPSTVDEYLTKHSSILTEEEINRWFNKETSYGKFIYSELSEEAFENCKTLILELAKYQKFNWKHVIGFMILS